MQIGKFFSPAPAAPDIASAVAAVTLKKADAVFAPESQGKGLKKVFDVRDRVPNPAFCEVGSGWRPTSSNKVKQAVLGHGAAGPGLDGWKASSAEPIVHWRAAWARACGDRSWWSPRWFASRIRTCWWRRRWSQGCLT